MNVKQTGNDAMRYTATLALLMGMAFMLPSFSEAVMGANASSASTNAAAVVTSFSTTSNKSIKCPAGYTCTPNQVPPSGITAKTIGNQKLALTYDSNKKEALLTATFNVTVDGGQNGTYVSQYPWISLFDSSGNSAYVNTMRTFPLSPTTKVEQKIGIYGDIFYWIPAHRQVKFAAMQTVDPKSLLAGTYYASLNALIGYSVTDYSQAGFVINTDSNRTNSVTIIGETSPYISSVNPYQANVGDMVTISGQRMNGALIYIDGVSLSNVPVTGSIDGTSLSFKVPALSEGWHIITVGNSNGTSNGAGIYVLAPVSAASVVVSLDAASPVTGTVQISPTAVTANVPLAIFDLKSQNGATTLTSFSVNMIESNPNAKGGGAISDLFTNIMIKAAGQTYAETSIVGNTITFSNISVALPADVSIPVVVYGSVAPNTNNFLNGSTASVNLPLSGIQAVDGNYVTVPVSQGSVVGLLSGSTITFSGSNVTVSNASTIPSTVTVSQTGTTTQTVSMNFSVTAGSDSIFISKEISTALTSPITASANPYMAISPSTITSDNVSGDGSTYFYVAPGQTKNFTAYYKAIGLPGSGGTVNISSLNYGTSSTGLSNLSYKDQYDNGALSHLKFTFAF